MDKAKPKAAAAAKPTTKAPAAAAKAPAKATAKAPVVAAKKPAAVPAKKPAAVAKPAAAKTAIAKPAAAKAAGAPKTAVVEESKKPEEEKIQPKFTKPQEAAPLPKARFQEWTKPENSESVVGKEEERGKMPAFKTIELRQLEMECKWAEENGKYMYIADMTG